MNQRAPPKLVVHDPHGFELIVLLNAPLHIPPSGTTGAANLNMSIAHTIEFYLAAGIPASKVHVGIPLYGHTFYVPDAGDQWNTFGLVAQKQGPS